MSQSSIAVRSNSHRLAVGLVASLLTAGLCLSPLAPARRAEGRVLVTETVPIRTSVSPSTVASGGTITITVEVDQVPAGGGAVQVSCTQPSLLNSPSGSWPYTLQYPDGSSTTRSFTVTANSVSSATSLNIVTAETGVDISNSANWRTVTGLTILGPD